jgi:hypothetical protein
MARRFTSFFLFGAIFYNWGAKAFGQLRAEAAGSAALHGTGFATVPAFGLPPGLALLGNQLTTLGRAWKDSIALRTADHAQDAIRSPWNRFSPRLDSRGSEPAKSLQ